MMFANYSFWLLGQILWWTVVSVNTDIIRAAALYVVDYTLKARVDFMSLPGDIILTEDVLNRPGSFRLLVSDCPIPSTLHHPSSYRPVYHRLPLKILVFPLYWRTMKCCSNVPNNMYLHIVFQVGVA